MMKKTFTIGILLITACAAASIYYGSCGRCGWPVDEDGTCTNPLCEQYGPQQD